MTFLLTRRHMLASAAASGATFATGECCAFEPGVPKHPVLCASAAAAAAGGRLSEH